MIMCFVDAYKNSMPLTAIFHLLLGHPFISVESYIKYVQTIITIRNWKTK